MVKIIKVSEQVFKRFSDSDQNTGVYGDGFQGYVITEVLHMAMTSAK